VDKKILRLLIVDDSPDDAEIATAALRKAKYMLKTQRVQDLAAMQGALEKSTWDVVLCEVRLSHLNAQMVLDFLKRDQHHVPLIVFTQTPAEADVVKLMQMGAFDVVRKDEAFRLSPVIERELRIAEERREWHAMAQKLNELETKHRAVVESARDAIGYCQDGMHIDANPMYQALFGYSQGELEGVPVMNLIEKSEQARFKDALRKGSQEPQEFTAIKKDGGQLHVELQMSTVTHHGETCVQIIASDISKRKVAESRLQYLNQHDPLTGLYNRHHFLQTLNSVLEDVQKGKASGGVVYLDLNQIKSINEEFGHAAGDRTLLRVARVFRDKLGDKIMLARFGGDEFAVLLLNQNESQINATAESLRTTLKENPLTESGKTFTLNCNFGVAMLSKDVSTTQKLMADAYRAAHPLQAVEPQPAAPSAPTAAPVAAPTAPTPAPAPATTPTAAPKRATPVNTSDPWAARLQTALNKNAFELHYQPIVNLHGEAAEYFEVLARLKDEDGRIIPAGEFMSAAVSTGLAPAIDMWITQRAIEALKELHGENRRATFFVNLCASTFREPDLIVQTQKHLRSMNIKPHYLSFEADESSLLASPAETRSFLQAVRTLGCRFTVDNFGNNMTNLNQLRDLPFDSLKIAGEHIRDLANDKVSQASLKALIQVAKVMEKHVIAKSVERAEDLAALWNLGVDYVQGHYFQEAESHLSYQFSADETIASDEPPRWASR
jgi:diguanylate cyclase (GGDEF)-like protein/PAS domain S-box-containing protein